MSHLLITTQMLMMEKERVAISKKICSIEEGNIKE